MPRYRLILSISVQWLSARTLYVATGVHHRGDVSERRRRVDKSDLTRAMRSKSGYSSANGACVEAARYLLGVVAVHDSKDPDGPNLNVSPAGWQNFLSQLKRQVPRNIDMTSDFLCVSCYHP